MMHLVLLHAATAAPVRAVTNFATVMTVWTALVNLATGMLLPQVVALVTHKLAPSWYKGLVLLFLSSLTGALTQLTTVSAGFDWRGWLLSWAQNFIVGYATHGGLTNGTLSGSDGLLARAFPGGVGKNLAA